MFRLIGVAFLEENKYIHTITIANTSVYCRMGNFDKGRRIWRISQGEIVKLKPLNQINKCFKYLVST